MKAAEIFPGEVFGELIVKGLAYQTKNYIKVYDCDCSCGRQARVRGQRLRAGQKSCKHCSNKHKAKPRRITKRVYAYETLDDAVRDVVLLAFPSFTNRELANYAETTEGTIDYLGQKHDLQKLNLKSKGFFWLTSNSSTSIKAGDVIYNWRVLRTYRNESDDRLFFECECLCEESGLRQMAANTLFAGQSKSCGCLRPKGRLAKNSKFVGEIHCHQLTSARYNAEKRGLTFDLTLEEMSDLFEKQERRCALSNRLLVAGNHRHKEITASLDRIDSSKGYVLGNVQWVYKDIQLHEVDVEPRGFHRILS